MTETTARQGGCTIMVADDDDGDRYLVQSAMEDIGVENDVLFVEDGQKLIDRLIAQLAVSHHARPNLPCLILLDLNMPGLHGLDVLKIVKGHPDLKGIPIVIMTNSKNPSDVETTYKSGANSFFTKPMNYSGLVDLMALLKTYWLETASLPYSAM